MIVLNIILFFIRLFLRLGRFLVISGLTFLGILYTIDSFTKSEYGIANLYLITGALAFLPLFVGLFVEFFLSGVRKGESKIKKMNTQYLNEDMREKPITH